MSLYNFHFFSFVPAPPNWPSWPLFKLSFHQFPIKSRMVELNKPSSTKNNFWLSQNYPCAQPGMPQMRFSDLLFWSALSLSSLTLTPFPSECWSPVLTCTSLMMHPAFARLLQLVKAYFLNPLIANTMLYMSMDTTQLCIQQLARHFCSHSLPTCPEHQHIPTIHIYACIHQHLSI